MTYEMHEIRYQKHLISGPLAGLTVEVAYIVDSKTCCNAQACLNAITSDEPAADALTGTSYYVSGVRCAEVEHQHVQEVGTHERIVTPSRCYLLGALITAYNDASDPAAMRTDEEHAAQRLCAHTTMRRIRESYIENVDYKELSNGALWPISR